MSLLPNLACVAALLPFSLQEKGNEAPEPPPVVAVEIPGIFNVHEVGSTLLAGQPTAEALEELAAAGFSLVIDLRMPGEQRGFEEPALVALLGMTYVNPAFGLPDQLTDEVFQEVRRLLRENRSEGVLLHCGSAVRVGAVWLAARVLDEGVAWDTALAEARRVGLRSEALEARAWAYVLGRGSREWGLLKLEIREAFPKVKRITVDELASRLREEGVPPLLLDARAPEEYAVSHLRGARRALSVEKALDVLKGAPRDREVIVYCSVGYRSGRLVQELDAEGFTRVRNLEGSIFEWANTGHAVYRGDQRVLKVHPFDEKWGRLLDRELWADLPQDG